MNNNSSKQTQESSAMSIIADAAAKAAELINGTSPMPFHNSIHTMSNHLTSNNIFDRNINIPMQLDSNSHNISGGGIPLKKRKATNAVVVNASDMDGAPKHSLNLSSSIEDTMTTSYPQQTKQIASVNTTSSIDILANNSSNHPALDHLPNSKSIFMTNTSITTPATPIGQVVESGQEQTGRWTREEHDAFLSALQKYGKEWKKVAAKVKTRTVVQTRTHAQKYFQKLQKSMAGGNDINNNAVDAMMMMAKDEDGNCNDGGSLTKKKGALNKIPQRRNGIPPLTKLMQEQEQAEATAAAAQLMAQMSSPALMHAKKSSASSFNIRQSAHESNAPTSFYTYSNPLATMKITAPTHEQVSDRVNKYGYPEPSPAACGKRKLAEIAAAQMLAGVAASGSKIPNSVMSNPTNLHSSPQLHQFNNVKSKAMNNIIKGNLDGPSLQIVNPDNLLGDGTGVKKRQRWMMGNSPHTPWEDQLEALVSNFKKKEKRSLSEASTSTNSSSSSLCTVLPPLQPQPSHSALHTAVISSDVNQVSQLLKLIPSISSPSLKPNIFGYTPLHSASCLSSNSLEITRLILSVGADVMERDRDGNTPLHWAVRGGNSDVVHVLVIRNCLLDAPNNLGETPLHWAMRAGSSGGAVVRTLLADGAKPHVFSKRYQRPIDVAALGFSSGPTSQDEIIKTRKNFFNHSPQSRTLILHHPECLEHKPKNENDWEVPGRIESIIAMINDEEGKLLQNREITLSSEFDRASLELLSRVHSAEYLAYVNKLSKEMERRKNEGKQNSVGGLNNVSVVPFTPMVQRAMLKDDSIEIGSHSDTSFGAGSLKAARRAAGAVQHSVDRVLMGRNSNAFCIVRPPGHHAGYNGLLYDSESSGFCIFNNIAAGAMHALSDHHRSRCKRCAILDIDVHHGNGTEDIVRKINDPERLLFFSVHLFDEEEIPPKKTTKKECTKTPGEITETSSSWKFYPGTGETDDVAYNVINVPIAPLWREKDMANCVSSFQTQTDTTRNPYNTRNKHRQKNDTVTKSSKLKETNKDAQQSTSNDLMPDDSSSYQLSNEKNKDSKDSDITSISTTSTIPNTTTPSQYLMGTGRLAYRCAIQHRLLPALRAFNPDLILISAGFDAAKDDVGNAKHLEDGKMQMGIDLEPEDYAWTTRKIMEVADICCQGRVVSVLEGGYGRTPLSPDEKLLDKSIFSKCALMHISALVDPYNAESRQSIKTKSSSHKQNDIDDAL